MNTRPGSPYPLGATWDGAGVNFALFSKHAERVELCRFDPRDLLLCVCNFTPVPRQGYRVGVPAGGFYTEVLNSDSSTYGGSNVGNSGGVMSEPVRWHGQPNSVVMSLPPLAVVWLRAER